MGNATHDITCTNCNINVCEGCDSCQNCNDGCQVTCNTAQAFCNKCQTYAQAVGYSFAWEHCAVKNEIISPNHFNKADWDSIITYINTAREKGTYSSISVLGTINSSTTTAVQPLTAAEFNRVANSVGGVKNNNGNIISAGDVIYGTYFTALKNAASAAEIWASACDSCNIKCDGCVSCQKCNTECQNCNAQTVTRSSCESCDNCDSCDSGESACDKNKESSSGCGNYCNKNKESGTGL